MEKTEKKDTIWGYYRKYHRMTTSSYFSKSDHRDKEAMLLALDSDYPISTARIRAMLTMFYTTLIYGIASTIWGFALRGTILWFAVGGAILGFLIGLMSALVVVRQRTVERAKDMQFVASATWGNYGIILGVIGVVIWIVRVIFFH